LPSHGEVDGACWPKRSRWKTNTNQNDVSAQGPDPLAWVSYNNHIYDGAHEMTELEKLLALQAIHNTKADYWLGVDMKDVDLLTQVFTPDAEIDFSSEAENAWAELPTPRQFAQQALRQLENFITAHHGHNPSIRFISDDEATAIWPMEDNLWAGPDAVEPPYRHLHGYGYYHDRYRKTEDGWKLSATTLKRAWVEMH
jgi:hypothetical protein